MTYLEQLPDTTTVTLTGLDDPETRGPSADGTLLAPMKLPAMEAGDLSLVNGEASLKLCQDGRIYVRGNLVATDLEVYEGMRSLLGLAPKDPK